MGLLFVTNCADAALGAFLVRRLAPQPFRFDNLRSTAIFAAFGAALSPVLLSFADAAISVATGWTAAYWAAFSTRVHSNVLTHLIVVPAIVTALTVDIRKVPAQLIIEAAIAVVALVATSVVAFGQPSGASASTPLLYLPLPLLVWAAVRFGPGGAGWSVLLVAFVASWNALHGRGPFTTQAPEADVQTLQLFLLSISAPLLLLSATIKERNLTFTALQDNEATVRQSLVRVQDLTGKLMAVQELEHADRARAP
jgi:two-component system, LuxR family, sensor kinase FixL